MEDEEIGIDDLVAVTAEKGVWTVVGLQDGELHFEVQIRLDTATRKLAASDRVILLQKATREDDLFALFQQARSSGISR
jgi:hypothetical protein